MKLRPLKRPITYFKTRSDDFGVLKSETCFGATEIQSRSTIIPSTVELDGRRENEILTFES